MGRQVSCKDAPSRNGANDPDFRQQSTLIKKSYDAKME